MKKTLAIIISVISININLSAFEVEASGFKIEIDSIKAVAGYGGIPLYVYCDSMKKICIQFYEDKNPYYSAKPTEAVVQVTSVDSKAGLISNSKVPLKYFEKAKIVLGLATPESKVPVVIGADGLIKSIGKK